MTDSKSAEVPKGTTLSALFTEQLPTLLKSTKSPKSGLVGFIVTSGPDRGFWVVSMTERKCRKGVETDNPDVVVEASGPLMAAFFAGALDVKQAVEQGALSVTGDPKVLTALVSAIG